ncbi:hypothetical protein [Candidatus Methylobacter oryzae]|uniref:Uncharacterized protein n=1 Tax=Candidatus Methylobacter oryzae TaxID=2497749 RepID=A0ABY3CGN6_9GAMM|nr:hypothetical protein [Candidatus Methylobacter oryzae]TRX02953.1 hypothetical protein EKO24_001315 [Candidatus Methylobacter oryzae]
MKILFAALLLIIPACLQADDSFAVQLPECSARIERRAVEAEVALVRSDCPLSLRSLTQLLETGFHNLFPGNSLPVSSVYLGRLMNYPQWSQDLAESAMQSQGWNAKRGRPKKTGETENHHVRMLLNGPAYPQALKRAFAQYGLSACIANVEKVLVFEAKDIFSDLAKMPDRIPSNARLPADAQVWLHLQPEGTICR